MSGRRRPRWKTHVDSHATGKPQDGDSTATLSRRHLRFGWWSLLVFLSLGIGLEALHGLKVAWYLDLAHTTRRHMWTLAHAHGTLLALINLVWGAILHHQPAWRPKRPNLASACLLSSAALLPAGFFLGGLRPYEGDPGLGVILVPVGGALLLFAVLLMARGKPA